MSKRTPCNFLPNLRAIAKEVLTQSLSKSTKAMRLTEGSIYLSKAVVAATVSPPYVAMRAWGIVPKPSTPAAAALASVEKLLIPPINAAYPSCS